MTVPRLNLAVAVLVVLTALGVSAWQQTRINRLVADNTHLQPQPPAPSQEAEKPQPPADAAELQRLEEEHEQLSTEVVKLRAAVAEKKTKSNSNRKDTLSDAEHAANYHVNMMGYRIELTPDQKEKIFAIYKKQAEAQAARALPRGGPTEADKAWKKQADADMDAEINTVLSPEQQAAFQKLKADEVTMEVRSVATSELSGMQYDVNLTEAQQDQVFQVFCDLARKNMDGETIGTERLLESLSGVLTAHQIELYRAYLSPTNSRGGTSLTMP